MNDEERDDDREERPRLKVNDRRKFTADGELRDASGDAPTDTEATDPSLAADSEAAAPAPEPAMPEASTDADPAPPPETPMPEASTDADPAPPPETPMPEASTDAAPAAPPATGTALPADGSTGEEPGDAAPQAAGSIADLPRDFTAFIEGMYLESMLYLGALPDPRSGETAEDLDMAKYKIDLLGMIAEKTQGNLSDAEKQQLEEVLYQLRMFYVQRTTGDDS